MDQPQHLGQGARPSTSAQVLPRAPDRFAAAADVVIAPHSSALAGRIGKDEPFCLLVPTYSCKLMKPVPLTLVRVREVADRADLGSLFRVHGRYVAKVAARILGRDAEVDDVVQDVFLEAASGLQTIRDPQAACGWRATITIRRADFFSQLRPRVSTSGRRPAGRAQQRAPSSPTTSHSMGVR
jgi:hypothetical protein